MRLFLLSLLTLTLSACGDIPPPDNEIKDPYLLKAAIDARVEQIQDARLKEVVLDYFGQRDGKQERIKVRQVIVVKDQDKLRIHTKLPGSEELLSVLVSDGTTFAIHQRDTNTYYKGTPSRENINRISPLKLDLSAQDIVRVMLGGAPWDRFGNNKARPTLAWNSKTGRYRLAVRTNSGSTLSMEVRHTDFAVLQVQETNTSGEATYTYEASSWKRVGAVSMPTFMRFVWPGKNLDFSLDVGETRLNTSVEDQIFPFPPPLGSQIIEVGG